MAIRRVRAIFGMRANILASMIFSVSTLAAGVLAASVLAQGIVAAQAYPVRPITIIVPLRLEGPPAGQRSPEALRAFQKSEIEKWWPIIKAAHITAE